MNTDKGGVLPAFLDLGEGKLHRAYVGKNLNLVPSEIVCQAFGYAIETRIARGQDHHTLVAQIRSECLNYLCEIGFDDNLFCRERGKQIEQSLSAKNNLRFIKERVCLGRKTRRAFCSNSNNAKTIQHRLSPKSCLDNRSGLLPLVRTARPGSSTLRRPEGIFLQ